MRRIIVFVSLIFLSLARQTKRYSLTVEEKAPKANLAPTTAVVRVLTAQEIRKLPFSSLSELLHFLTSLTVIRRGQVSFDLAVRGASPKRTIILLNGMRVNDPQTEHFNMELPVSLEQIKRIEVIRGGTSTFYGSSSAAGAINIVTTSGRSSFSLLAGEKGLFSYSASASLGGFTVSLFSKRSSGYYPGREFNVRDISVQYSKGAARLFFGAGLKEMGEANFYAPYPSWERIESYLFSGSLQFEGLELSLLSRSLHDHFVLDRERPDWYENRHRNFLHSARLTKRISLPWGRFSLGLEASEEGIKSFRLGDHRRESLALMGGFSRAGDGFSLDLGLRTEFFSGNKPFYGFYLGYQRALGRGFLFSASLGNSFRLPNFTELYYSSPANLGNPELRPEKSLNAEINLEGSLGQGRAVLSLFWRKDRDLIDWVRSEPTAPWKASNLPSMQSIGMEVLWSKAWRSGSFSLGLTRIFLHYRIDQTVKYALVLDKFKLSSSLVFHRGRFSFSSALSYREMVLGQKGVFFNARVSLRLWETAQLFLQGSNLLNTVIEEIPGVKIEGQWLSAGLSFKL